ncbi:hypothetical protein PAPHI01_0609 [Pancytospora philotis]|nr:hypothetical protein PAPHI01_0609 [Pancytospora philotis]
MLGALFASLLHLHSSPADAKAHNLGVTERLVDGIRYFVGTKDSSIEIQNVVEKNERLYMRSGLETHALMRWENPCATDNWAFSFAFNKPHLASDEIAGIYLRYTAEPQLIGNFKGGASVYDGLMLGFEMHGAVPSVAYAMNKGKDYDAAAAKKVVSYDEITPARLRDVEDLTFKIISTSKNLKVEVYGGDELIYDNFRVYTTGELGVNKAGGYFSIVANYAGVSSAKAFELRSAELFERAEGTDYATAKSHTKALSKRLRPIEDINHHDVDTTMLIHHGEAAIHSVKTLLGDLPDTKLIVMHGEVSQQLHALDAQLNRLEEALGKRAKSGLSSARLNAFDLRIKRIQRSVSDFQFFVREKLQERAPQGSSVLEHLVFAGGVLALYILASRELSALRAVQNFNK